MAEKFGLRNEIRELKIGQSFTNPKSAAFHTIKYDFKPASVDTNKKATVDVAGNNQVTVTVPHLDGAGVPQTVFKGSQRPYQKECVLIIDRVTGEITLEKLGCNIQVKKTRSEFNKHFSNADRLSQSTSSSSLGPIESNKPSSLSQRSQTPPTAMVGQRVTHKTKVTSGKQQQQRVRPPAVPPQQQHHHLVPKHSPMHASPSYQQRSPMHTKSPRRDMQQQVHVNHGGAESHNPSMLASLPMIGVDDYTPVQNTPSSQNSSSLSYGSNEKSENNFHHPSDNENGVGEITDTSSSSSDSDSDSEEDTTLTNKSIPVSKMNGYSNGTSSLKLDTQILNDDLCLSESGSDSD